MVKREEREKTLTLQTGISNKGFTLLEVLIVLFIISVTFGIVLPSINTERALSSEVKRFASLLRYLLDEATTKKTTLYLTIRMPERKLIYETPEGKKEESFPNLVEINSSLKGNIRDSTLTIFFYPSGVREIFVFLFQDKKEIYKVNINPLSSRVKIERLNH